VRSERLADRVALVTGAAGGIGRAVAERLASEGASVGLLDVDPGVTAVAEAIAADGARALAIHGSVTANADVEGAVGAVVSSWGRLDIVVNNAGITHGMAEPPELADMGDDEWDAVHDVNLKGTFRTTRAALPHLRTRGGVILCISSIIGSQQGWAGRVHYASSKAGVEGFVRALAVEVARDGIRVVGVAPGLVETAQTLDPSSAGREALAEWARDVVPLGFVALPTDLAALVAFLVSDEARYLHGTVVTADGGMGVRSVNRLPERVGGGLRRAEE
jgi:3-oxoacyl-[acyl-carrier protein] reductase